MKYRDLIINHLDQWNNSTEKREYVKRSYLENQSDDFIKYWCCIAISEGFTALLDFLHFE